MLELVIDIFVDVYPFDQHADLARVHERGRGDRTRSAVDVGILEDLGSGSRACQALAQVMREFVRTTTGALPPSSKTQGLRYFAASAASFLATTELPVNYAEIEVTVSTDLRVYGSRSGSR